MDIDQDVEQTDNMIYQLRVRISDEERDFIERLRIKRGKGESISDIVRLALNIVLEIEEAEHSPVEQRVKALAALLKRDPFQVRDACVEGIFDLIENKAKVPLIVMESQLHLSYGNPEGTRPFAF
jgi:Arc/MetJ-type ribon-helix-helix transcriptional regulator